MVRIGHFYFGWTSKENQIDFSGCRVILRSLFFEEIMVTGAFGKRDLMCLMQGLHGAAAVGKDESESATFPKGRGRLASRLVLT